MRRPRWQPIVALAAFAAILVQAPVPSPADEMPAPPEGMVRIPAGEFLMGTAPDDPSLQKDELPQRRVYLPAFDIDQFEVSNLEYKRFVEATGYPPPPDWKDGTYAEGADFFPVHDVSWWDASAYAKWAGKRLPTEEEWEKAARGTDGRRFPWGDTFEDERANASDAYMPINAKLAGASPYGVMNMAGNVAEWTASVYAPYPPSDLTLPPEFGGNATAAADGRPLRPPSDPQPPSLGPPPDPDDPRLLFFTAEELRDRRDRVYRGGSINNFTQFLRAANREHAGPNERWYNIGFRCAKDVEPEGAAR